MVGGRDLGLWARPRLNPATIHARFSALEGASQIATRFAAEHLAWWLKRQRPQVVCEVGSGIGTLSAVILDTVSSWTTVWAVEPDAWCWEQWRRNLGAAGARVLHATASVPTRQQVDFLVLDGGDKRPDYYTNLARRALVFVEGNRRPQRAVLEAELTLRRRSYACAQWKPSDRSKGVWIVLTAPRLWERMWFAAVRVREAILDLMAWALGCPVGKRRPQRPAGLTA